MAPTANLQDIALAQAGDADARRRLLVANLPLVIWCRERWKCRLHNIELDDATQEGLLALNRAISKFDFSRGVQFSTYATTAIVRSMIRASRENTTVRISEVSQLRNRIAPVKTVGNFDVARWQVEDENTNRVDDTDLMRVIHHCVDSLPHRTAAVIRSRFLEGKKLREVGKELGCTKEWVRQIEQQGLEMLRELLAGAA